MGIGAYIGFFLSIILAGFVGYLWYDHIRFWRQFSYYGGKRKAHPIWAARRKR